MSLAPLNRFKPSSKIFYWPFQGGTSFVDFLCFCSVLCLLCLCARLFICALWSPAGKGLTSWLSFVVSTVSLSLSHWYPGSGVVLDCIDSWSLHPYLLFLTLLAKIKISRKFPDLHYCICMKSLFNTLNARYIFMTFLFCRYFLTLMFWKIFFQEYHQLNPEKARRSLGIDLDPIYLQKLSADDSIRC